MMLSRTTKNLLTVGGLCASYGAFKYTKEKSIDYAIKYNDERSDYYHVLSLFLTNNDVERIIVRRPWFIQYLRDGQQTDDVCNYVLENHHYSLKFIKNKTQQHCQLAFEVNPYQLEFIPQKLQTELMCTRTAISYPSCIKYISVITPRLAKLAVSFNGDSLREIPDEFRTPEICKIAVEKDPRSLKDVPGEFRTSEICKIDVEKDPYAIEFCKIQTKELVDIAFAKKPETFSLFDDKLKTYEMCVKAYKRYPLLVKYIPKHLYDIDLVNLVMEDYFQGANIEYIPDEFKTYELCMGVIGFRGDLLKHVPKKLITEEMILKALNSRYSPCSDEEYINNPKYLNVILESERLYLIKNVTQEICDLSIELNPKNIIYVPKKFQNKIIYANLIVKYPSYFRGIVEKSEYLSSVAIRKDHTMIEYVENPTEEMYDIIDTYYKDGVAYNL